MEQYDFEVINNDDETVATIGSVVQGSNALWPRIVELANIYVPGCRIRVTDQAGDIIMLVGVTTALHGILTR